MNLPYEINAATAKILNPPRAYYDDELRKIDACVSLFMAERRCEISKARATIRAMMIVKTTRKK